MKKALLCYCLLPIICLLAAGVGRLFYHGADAREEWDKYIGPWLGEAPAGIQIFELEELHNICKDKPLFLIPANPQLKAEAIRLFGLKKAKWGVYPHVLRDLQEAGFSHERARTLYATETPIETAVAPDSTPTDQLSRIDRINYYEYAYRFLPYLVETEDGSMFIRLVHGRAGEEFVTMTPPHPEFLDKRQIDSSNLLYIPLKLLILVLPSIICCISWLYVMGNPPCGKSSIYICVVIPAISGAMMIVPFLNVPHDDIPITVLLGAFLPFMTLNGLIIIDAAFDLLLPIILNLICTALLLVPSLPTSAGFSRSVEKR